MGIGFVVAPILVLFWNVELSPRVSLMFPAVWGFSFVVRALYVGKLVLPNGAYPLWHPRTIWVYAVFLGGGGFLFAYCLIGIGELLVTYDPIFP